MANLLRNDGTTEPANGIDVQASSLQETRQAKCYSLEDLAIATGLTIAEIRNVETLGERAPEHHVERIRNALR